MAKNAIVSEELASKFKTEKETPYTRWVKAEGLDIIPSFYVQNLRTVELKPWARRGGNAVFLNHDASRTSNDCYVMEIPPGKSLAPHRQLYEEMILVLSGRGSTTVWNDAGARITFEWKEGALFAIPLNCHHQHFNGSGVSLRATSPSPMRRRSSTSTKTSISSSTPSTTSRIASPASRTISARRASRRASC
jgi:mannose-6-phosphate isomerase-like protein (cupin superfamily)